MNLGGTRYNGTKMHLPVDGLCCLRTVAVGMVPGHPSVMADCPAVLRCPTLVEFAVFPRCCPVSGYGLPVVLAGPCRLP